MFLISSTFPPVGIGIPSLISQKLTEDTPIVHMELHLVLNQLL